MRQVILVAAFISLGAMAKAQTAIPDNQNEKWSKAVNDFKPRFGIKAGYNVAKVTGSTVDYKPNTKNGFMVAAFYAPASRGGLGYRTELVFSRQGFGFDENGQKSSVTSDYVYLPNFTTFGITRFVQLQVGGQVGYLLKSSKESATDTKSQDISSFANRLDYGAAFGAEIYPVKGLIIGGRYNLSFGNAYKQQNTSSPMSVLNPLPFNPSDVKTKNAVINFFIGFQF